MMMSVSPCLSTYAALSQQPFKTVVFGSCSSIVANTASATSGSA